MAQEEVDSSDLTEIAYYVTVLSPPVAQLHLDDDQFKSYQQSIYLLSKDHNNYNEIEIEETFAQISQLNIDTWSKANAHYTHWLIFIVMGFIFLSLSYVAWAKYKAETTG
ncbi:hypothetical protein JCM21714_331 [Gracilibacillus boraciitolerans JCM 21714]|uniref:Uncharacterized protein n=1 Tax=Gracilibacillus boraciitolerans JCM 21714 TaxID=1298598 RepID=W4VEZ2_9BACI|nr:sporulation protein YpjB [Gracilibacillus boraciitolerans]GAE91383.1 hypothetical protein JCM21714_331 [Gracilibacillus boraciitolerans JCM 21714]